jgi:hypothetical protein
VGEEQVNVVCAQISYPLKKRFALSPKIIYFVALIKNKMVNNLNSKQWWWRQSEIKVED